MAQIIPIKELKDTASISERCHSIMEPIYITKNGYGDMVLMSVELYESMQKKWNMYNDIEISEGEIKQGRVKDARESLLAMRKKYGL